MTNYAWTKTPPPGEMFIWAYRKDDGGWNIGLGYWTVTSGQWRDAYNWNGNHHTRATHFHPMPSPPNLRQEAYEAYYEKQAEFVKPEAPAIAHYKSQHLAIEADEEQSRLEEWRRRNSLHGD